jgi:hypothetical protein
MDHRGGPAREIEVALYELRARTTIHGVNVPQPSCFLIRWQAWRCSRC